MLSPKLKHETLLTPLTVREYSVGGTKYIVKASVKDDATEDAVAKVRRLIRNEIVRRQTET